MQSMFRTILRKQPLLWSCLLAVLVVQGQSLQPNTIQGRILKVSPSPGFWTGTVESVQWFDMHVVKSRIPAIKPGVELHIGVPVLKGNPLFDKQTAQFAKDKVTSGKHLEVKISSKCSRA